MFATPTIATIKARIARYRRTRARKRILTATRFPEQCPDPSIFTE